MKIVLWIGNEAQQKALANKIHAVLPLHGIVTETRKHQPKITLGKIFVKIYEKLFISSVGSSWMNMGIHFSKNFPNYPNVKMLDVENINSDSVHEFSKDADLIVVSGTRMIKKKLLELKPKVGIINLHTGLSPYVKGGPNCTNWCIANEDFHLIGNTIMWIDSGIDSGHIISTEFTPLKGDEHLNEIHIKVMEHAHELYGKAIKHVIGGHSNHVAQKSIAEGKTYYNKDWSLTQKKKLAQNIKKLSEAIKSGKVAKEQEKIKTVKI